ncbi:preprotein translocase subunit SecY [Cereibacter sphaeroides]|uniref:preprotein translocase subunit SecY n=1 Tax=Cereibacter sphaeroides TaxID=1063 RepID=UPI001F2252E1|nr:preprotein translocase subunit SecY [Cereibacter sphaeroides]MCE6959359.1 preprotein translocase subunit SecY [Cereibacter sphaeroides]MCE6972951.1 preprotein translocase subunit SecY [Cereibacter sphaeroides]
MPRKCEKSKIDTWWKVILHTPELRQRILFTLGLLMVCRVGTYVPVPGVDPVELKQLMAEASTGIGGMVSMFTGGALGRMGIFALGIAPFVTASILIQLPLAMMPNLEFLKEANGRGARRVAELVNFATAGLALVQGYGLAVALEAGGLVLDPGWSFRISTTITIGAGTMFLLWLGRQITLRGIGNGISLIIVTGILSEMPAMVLALAEQEASGALNPATLVATLFIALCLVVLAVTMERAVRRIPIHHPGSRAGMKAAGEASSFMPVKVNPAGVTPVIFASSLLMLPVSIASFPGGQGVEGGSWLSALAAHLGPDQPLHYALFAALIVFFTYFHTAKVAFRTEEKAQAIRLQGGFVGGCKPGRATEEHLGQVVQRILVLGSAYLVLICLLPEILRSRFGMPFFVAGTSMLIVVVSLMEIVQQVQTNLLSHRYGELIEKSTLRRRRDGARRVLMRA